MKVRSWSLGALAAVGLAVGVGVAAGAAGGSPAAPSIVVYKSPSCGCCGNWVQHLEANGFTVRVVNQDNLAEIKATSGVPAALAACHTAIIEGYVIEGHVPADLVLRLLKERPKIAGLAVPGMPMGSPGMEGPRKDAYQVLAFDGKGATSVYARR